LPLPSARPVGSVAAPRFLSCFALPFSCKGSQKLTLLFSHSSALLEEEHSANSFGSSGFRTLLQNTGGVPTPFFSFLPLLTTHNSLFTNSFRICSSAKHARKPFRMRSFKTRHLKSFRMCSYKKTGGGGPPPRASSGFPIPTPDRAVGARHVVPSLLLARELARVENAGIPQEEGEVRKGKRAR
jgi:hypothetical protein